MSRQVMLLQVIDKSHSFWSCGVHIFVWVALPTNLLLQSTPNVIYRVVLSPVTPVVGWKVRLKLKNFRQNLEKVSSHVRVLFKN